MVLSVFICVHLWRKLALCGGLAGLQGAGGFFEVVEVVFLGSDNLVVFVAFAGDEDDVAGGGVGEDADDGGAAVDLDGGGAAGGWGEAGDDLVEDRLGVFGSGVVAGDVEGIGEFFGGAGHSGALGAVAVATAAEEDAEFAAGEGA